MNEQQEILRQQSNEELIESIFEMQSRMKHLEKWLADLEAKTKPRRKTPKNSSPPPKKPAHKRGPKPGHPGCSRVKL